MTSTTPLQIQTGLRHPYHDCQVFRDEAPAAEKDFLRANALVKRRAGSSPMGSPTTPTSRAS